VEGSAIISVEERSTAVFVKCRGELTIYEAPDMRKKLIDLVEQGKTRFILDMSEVTFIDSSGLGLIVGLYRRIYNIGGSALALVATEPNILRVFKVSGIDRVIKNIFSSVAEAEASI